MMTSPPAGSPPRQLLELSARASRRAAAAFGQGPQTVSPLRGLRLLGQRSRTAFASTLYEPVLCLILQGAKVTTFGGRTYRMAAGDCLLVTHDLPVRSRVTEVPYLALLLDLDLDTLRGIDAELEETADRARALEVYPATPHLLDALGRYLALAESPADARVLGPLIARELHYRLLMEPPGGMLRGLMRADSHASAVARAIARLRRDFRSPLPVAALAREAGMSVSSFHRHFKAVTALSPLQYQKELRLLEASRLLAAGAASVSSAALDVGYESASQFSREYARRFGRPPRRDLPRAGAPHPSPGG